VNLATVPLTSTRGEAIGYMLMLEDITKEKRLRNTMSRYMSKTVMDQLLEGGEAVLGGTGRDVSVLFADIRGFTSISERLGAKETVALLNEYFTEMVDIVFAHNGVLDKYIGDMIMAVFGSVLQSKDDPHNAVLVGNRMMTGLYELNARRAARGGEADPDRRRHQHRQCGGRQHRIDEAHGIHRDRRPGQPRRAPGRRQQVLRHLDPDLRRHLGGRQGSRADAGDRPDPAARTRQAGGNLRGAGPSSEDDLPEPACEVLAAFREGLGTTAQRDWVAAERCFSQAAGRQPGRPARRKSISNAAASTLRQPAAARLGRRVDPCSTGNSAAPIRRCNRTD
jgi:hypothetical protein